MKTRAINDIIEIIVLHETRKALLISDNEKVVWIMKRQRRDDGSLTAGAIKALKESTKTYADYEIEAKVMEEKRKKQDEYLSNCIQIHHLNESNVAVETERAFLFKLKGVEFWIPKGCVKATVSKKNWTSFIITLRKNHTINYDHNCIDFCNEHNISYVDCSL